MAEQAPMSAGARPREQVPVVDPPIAHAVLPPSGVYKPRLSLSLEVIRDVLMILYWVMLYYSPN